MHNLFLPVSAALACAVCNGTAAVLQKVSADKQVNATSLDAKLLWRLFQDKLYVGGVALDLIGWLFTLYAVQHLPLFLVEAVIAASIAVTALIELIFMHHTLHRRSYIAILVIISGLVLLAAAATPERSLPVGDVLKWVIILGSLPIACAGYLASLSKSHKASIILAMLGGLAFADTLLAGRVIVVATPLWHTLYDPLSLAIAVSSVLGIWLFSTALQRAQATTVNAAMTASQTLLPAAVGIAFLGDSARDGLWYLVVVGSGLTLFGVVILAQSNKSD